MLVAIASSLVQSLCLLLLGILIMNSLAYKDFKPPISVLYLKYIPIKIQLIMISEALHVI
jgi:hypothetical protein